MAINFPNFLAAPLYKPDFSGISDVVENYYKGKAMPKDDLIKQIQAQFAKPNAQEALTGLRLGNERSRLANSKERLEQQQNAALEAEIAKALRGQGNPQNAPTQIQQIPQMSQQQPNPDNVTFQQGQNPLDGLPPALMQVIQQMRQQQQAPQGQQPGQQQMPQMGQDAGAPSAPESAPAAPDATAPEPNPLQIITQGEPRLASIDALYDRNPLSRALLEKKGFKKSQKIEFDKKTGQTRIMTTYPSGKVTLQMVGSPGSAEDGVPLTNKMVSQHQRVISSVDNALPMLEKLKAMPKHSNIYGVFGIGGNTTANHEQVKYQRLVSSLKDNLLGAFALNPTEHGLKTVEDMLKIGGRETEAEYKEAIDDLISDLKAKKQYSAGEVKRSNKIQPVSRMDSGQSYSSDDWEPAQ